MTNNKHRRTEAMSKLDREIKSRDRSDKTKPLGVIVASVVVILALIGAIVFFATRDDDAPVEAEGDATTSTTEESTTQAPPEFVQLDGKRKTPLAETVTCSYEDGKPSPLEPGKPPTENVPATGTVTVTLDTSDGPIPLTLDRAASPCTVNSIVHLAEKGFYNNTQCHRLTTEGIKVLQCGSPNGRGDDGPGYRFADEYPVDEADGQSSLPVIYPRGSVAMANAGPGTNGSQFFLNYGDSPLPPAYTYFGTIGDEGLSSLDAIAEKGTENGSPDGRPAKDVTITTVTVQ